MGCVCSQMSQPFTSLGLALAHHQQEHCELEQLRALVDSGCWDCVQGRERDGVGTGWCWGEDSDLGQR